ncbi:MAG TPA: Ig-like domain-containing protein, partial [Methylomirabilota bacterium]|nr:Ig-like domain-containing protein [Methylomirabilota bacterium]
MNIHPARNWAAVVLVFCTTFAAHAWNPVANPDSYTTAQNVTLNVAAPGVLANDSDPDGQTITAVRVTNPSHGTLTLNANGSFTYRPATNYIGSDSFRYRASDGAKLSGTVTVSLTVTPPPITIVSPPANQAVCPGGTATFSVTATGTGLRYQWRFGTNNLSGKTNSTLVLNNVTAANAGTYSVVLSATGTASKTNSATLTLSTPVSATPLTSAMRAIGGIVLFQTTASGTGPFTYVWKKGNAVIAGQTSSSLMLTNLQIANSGLYSVIVSGACRSVTNSATLTVDSCFQSVDVMLVLDRSGSMTGQPYNDARSAASNFVHNLHLGGTNLDQAGLVSYNSSTTLDRVLTNSVSSLEQGIASIPA